MFTLHTEALAWLRYGKRMPIVCTEAGKWNADVLGMNSRMCIEVEIKHSISDLRADFKNKAHKHFLYKQANPKHATGYEAGWHTNIPNYFYFLAPAELKDKALEIITEKAPYAGLIVRSMPAWNRYAAGKDNMYIIKKPERLHKEPPTAGLVHAASMRMGSEIASLRLLIDTWDLTQAKKEELGALFHQRIDGIEGALDIDNIEADLERRGRELAWVMTKKNFDQFSDVEKASWLFRAQELLNLRRGPPEEMPVEKID